MVNLSSISKLSKAKTRSISPENVYGEKGRGGMAENSDTPQESVARIGQHWNGANQSSRGCGWKIRPAITLPADITTPIMDIDGPAVIQHIWFTLSEKFNS